MRNTNHQERDGRLGGAREEDKGLVWFGAWEDFAWARRFLEAAYHMFELDPGDFPGPGNPVRSQAIKNERLALSCLAWMLVTVLS